ncbi:MAG: hypothetical protein ACKVQW_10550 [Pyrinomonadaceae bacterium]
MVTSSKRECPFEDEIVSYMYGEIDSPERDEFETHLAKCMTCTDDFAAISNARFSVFEWRKEEFDALATPNIVIPELAKPATSVSVESGWFDSLAGLLAFARSPFTVAASILLCLGLGFIALSYFRTNESLMAANDISVPAVKITEPENVQTGRDVVADPDVFIDQEIKPTVVRNQRKPANVYKALPADVKRKTGNSGNPNRSPGIAGKPVLNDFNDDGDDSLRLSALLDEIGG